MRDGSASIGIFALLDGPHCTVTSWARTPPVDRVGMGVERASCLVPCVGAVSLVNPFLRGMRNVQCAGVDRVDLALGDES